MASQEIVIIPIIIGTLGTVTKNGEFQHITESLFTWDQQKVIRKVLDA